MNRRLSAFLVAGILLLSGGASWIGFTVLSDGPGGEIQASSVDAIDPLASYEGLPDRDSDGLADNLENYVTGSDPDALSTTRNGIPDGWFHQYGYDPTLPGVEALPGAIPPASEVPPVYGAAWPQRLAWTLEDAYRFDRPADWNESRDGPWDNGVDPREWEAASGLPAAWLVHYGLDPTDPDLGGQTLVEDGIPVGEAFRTDTDPTTVDTDGDGLTDADERRIHETDPREFSTSGSGLADGWLVRHGLPLHDSDVALSDPSGKGLTLRQTYTYSVDRLGLAAVLGGDGLDPSRMDTGGHGVPDGWLIDHGLDPLDPAVGDRVLGNASDFEAVRDLDRAPKGVDPLPDRSLTVRDAYRYGRPATWSEARDGPWRNGLDPGRQDFDLDGLPDVVEIRGWYLNRSVAPGELPAPYHVTSDPRLNDTDGDGLLDGEEYHGSALHKGLTYSWDGSDPTAADTAFSGLTDLEKVFGFITDDAGETFRLDAGGRTPGNQAVLEPSVADSDGDGLRDGDEARYWILASRWADNGSSYGDRFPGSLHEGTEWFQAVGLEGSVSDALSPFGDADGDGVPNLLDFDSDGDGLADGWEVDPSTLPADVFPTGGPRAPTDPANPDTDGDGLGDEWEVRNGLHIEGSWDLDPARWHTGDGQTKESDANLDEDVVQWTTHHDDGSVVAREWPFTNGQEHAFGTDPHRLDESSDGVSEGWMVFWGHIYPGMVAAAGDGPDAREELGDIVPEASALTARESRFQDPLAISDPVKAVYAYRKAEPVPMATCDAAVEGTAEVVVDGETRCVQVEDAEHEHLHSLDQELALNPYLDDTDGDGVPDAFESLYTRRCPIDPILSDGGRDADADGLDNRKEFQERTDPCGADTDLDGFGDFTEVDAGGDPLTPDVDGGGAGGNDPDEDQIPTEQEAALGTNPFLPDSDGDGLLDRMQGQEDEVTLTRGQDDEAIGLLLSYGLLHEEKENGQIVFHREPNAGASTDPMNDHGIPHGWALYRFGFTGGGASSHGDYACGRPSWWDEAALGVWWWGAGREDDQGDVLGCGDLDLQDLDRDGLDDTNGEDPVPAASHYNLGTDEEDRLPEALTTATPLQLSRRLGAAWGECAGDPDPCQSAWDTADHDGDGIPDHQDRLPVRFTDLAVTLPKAENGTPFVPKPDPFLVTGRLVLDCTDNKIEGCAAGDTIAVRSRTVLAHAEGVERPVGVNVTNATGGFRIEACLCTSHSFAIPAPGMVVMGKANGTVSWTNDLSGAKAGETIGLDVRAYATTTTFWNGVEDDHTHPHHQEFPVTDLRNTATAAASPMSLTNHSLTSFTVRSQGVLALDVPGSIPWPDDGSARSLPVGARLVDIDGTPAKSGTEVQLSLDGKNVAVATAADGSVNHTFSLGASVGAVHVEASFNGTDDLTAASAGTTVTLQAPLDLNATVELPEGAPGFSLGDDVVVRVALTSLGAPVAGQEVTTRLGDNAATAVTGEDGTAVLRVLASGIEPATHSMRVESKATPAYTGAKDRVAFAVLADAVLDVQMPVEAEASQVLPIHGRLRLNDGSPLVGAELWVSVDGTPLTMVSTVSGGSFEASPQLPDHLAPGGHVVTVLYEGEPGRIHEQRSETKINVVSPTSIEVQDASTSPGRTVDLSAVLKDLGGRPVRGQVLEVHLDGDEVARIATDAQGQVLYAHHVPASSAYGVKAVTFRYGGSENGTFGSSVGSAVLRVGEPVTIGLADGGTLVYGTNNVSVPLHSLRGDPLVGLDVDLLLDGVLAARGRTDAAGSFHAHFTVPDDQTPGPVEVEVFVPAQGPFNQHRHAASWDVKEAVRVVLVAPSEVGRGSDGLPLEVAVLDRSGDQLTGGGVTLEWLGGTHRVELSEGETVLPVPGSTPLGDHLLRATYHGSDSTLPVAEGRTLVVKDGVRFETVGLSEPIVGDRAIDVKVRLEAATGEPLANRTVGLRMGNVGVPVLVTSNETGWVSTTFEFQGTGEVDLVATFAGEPGLASSRHVVASLKVVDASAPGIPTAAWILATLGVLAVAVVLVKWRLDWRNRLASKVEKTYRRMEADNIWSARVFAAYMEVMEMLKEKGLAAEGAGTMRQRAQWMVDRLGVPDAAAVDLVWLHERAAYSEAGVQEADMPRLVEVLRAIRDALVRPDGRRGRS